MNINGNNNFGLYPSVSGDTGGLLDLEQKLQNFTASVGTDTNIGGTLIVPEIAIDKIYDSTKTTYIDLNTTDVSVNATNFIVNGDNIGNQITVLENKTQHISTAPGNVTEFEGDISTIDYVSINSELDKITPLETKTQNITATATNTTFTGLLECDTFKLNSNSVAIGNGSGQTNQDSNSVAIGRNAGGFNQQRNAVAIGSNAGITNQGQNTIAMGNGSGQTDQLSKSVAIGFLSGQTNQDVSSVAIGNEAGKTDQGQFSVAIGSNAGKTNQHNNSIVLNAGTVETNTEVENSFYVNPIRDLVGPQYLSYNPTTKEITYEDDTKTKITTVENKTQFQTVINATPFELTESFGYMTSDTLPSPYVATASSISQLFLPFRAFDSSNSTFYTQTTPRYDGSNNHVNSDGKTGIAKSGEWVVLDMSLQYLVKSVVLRGRNGDTQTPIEWSIIYSTDGTNYDTAYYTATQTINSNELTVILPNITKCRYIGIQIHKSIGSFATISVFKLNVQLPITKFLGSIECDSIADLENKTHFQSLSEDTYELTESFGYMTSNTAPSPFAVSSSSIWSDAYQSFSAFDGVASTIWSSANAIRYDGVNNSYTGTNGKQGITLLGEWVVLDMNTSYLVKSVSLKGGNGRDGQNPTAYSIIYSNDGTNYDTAIYSTQTIVSAGFTVLSFPTTKCRYIGLQVHQSGTDRNAMIGSFNVNVLLPITKFVGNVEADIFTLKSNKVALGALAGLTSQGNNSVAIGLNAGNNTQGTNGIAIGNSAGNNTQSDDTVAIGREAGLTSQGQFSVAVGNNAGRLTQGTNSVAVGRSAGNNGQGNTSIAVGFSAGIASQGDNSVAIGTRAGNNTQGNTSIAIGFESGLTNQLGDSISIGSLAGRNLQGVNCISIGSNAGLTSQSSNSISIGRNAGIANQHTRTTIINALGGTNLNSTSTDSLYIAPIRPASNTHFLKYNVSTGEITYEL